MASQVYLVQILEAGDYSIGKGNTLYDLRKISVRGFRIFHYEVYNIILQEIITAFNKLGIEFDELSAREKLQHILDITPVVKTKKLSPASAVEIERLIRRLLYQLRIKSSLELVLYV